MATRIKSSQIADGAIVAADLHSAIAVSTTASGTFGSVIVDNYTLGSNRISTNQANSYNGDIMLDAAGKIILDTDVGNVQLKDNGQTYAEIERSNGNVLFYGAEQDKNIEFKGNVSGTATTALTLDFANSGRATFVENVSVGGVISTSDTTGSTNTTSGALTVAGGIGVAENAYVGGNVGVTGVLSVTNTTTSTNSSTGSLLVSGGAGIAENLNVGGNVVVTGNLQVDGTTATVNSTTLDVADLNITVAKNSPNAAAADGAGLTVDDGSSGTEPTILYGSTSNSFNFNRNVGINTTISGGTTADTYLHIYSDEANITPLIKLQNNTGENDSSEGVSIDFVASGDKTAIGSRIIGTRAASGANMDLRFHTARDAFAMIIDESQQVGLGTTDPSLKLDVATSSGAAGSFNRHLALTRGTTTGGFLGTYRAAANNDVDRVALGIGSTPTVTISSNLLDVTGGISVSEERHTVRPTLLLDFANSKRTPPNLRFSRSSSATYWGGSFTRGGENIFENSVGGNLPRARTNFVSSTTGPDGTGSAEIYSPDTQTGTHYITISANAFQSASANQRTISVYAKYINTVTHIVMGVYGYNAARAGACFDVQNGTFANYASTLNGATNDGYSIEDVGNGWRRYAVTITVPSGSQGVGNVTIAFNNAATTTVIPSYTGAASNADQIGIFGLQIENRDSVTAYTPTTGYKITESIPLMKVAPVNYARIDHHPDTGICRGLLIEEQRINYIPYSDFSGGWTVANGGRKVANYAMAPDGTKTANSISKTDGNVGGYVRTSSSISVTNGEPLIFSVFAKAGSFNFVEIGTDAFGNGGAGGTFDLSNGTVYSGNGTIENIGGGWHRCILRGDATSTTVTPFLRAKEFGNSNGESHGYHNILAWGAQLETGSNAKFVTSYIPTAGSATTRTPEYAGLQIQPESSNSGFFFNPNKGTFYTEQYFPWDGSNDTTTRYPVSLRNISVLVLYKNSNSNAINTFDNSTALSRTVTSPGLAKLAMGYEQGGDKNLSYNGSTTSNTFNGGAWLDNYSEWYAYSANDFMFGNDNNNHAWIKKIAYYPEKMTNSQLSALTENN